ncbi:MAG: biopolymer transporter ExbD [Planctomycetes bacterium]|nr:biopolymer transporter ExbD [Planctomycetota bacterium]
MAGGGGGFTFSSSPSSSLDDNPLVKRKPAHDEAKFDITAMIDLVFMMNIFFLVTSVTAALAEMDLPTAKHCSPSDRDTSILITIVSSPDRGPGKVYLGEPEEGKLVVEGDEEKTIKAAVEAGVRSDKKTVLIKAEKSTRLRDISRVGSLAVSVPGTELKLAVIERE